MNEKTPREQGGTAAKPRRKKRRRMSRFHTAVILFAAILAVSTALVVLLVAGQGSGEDASEQPSAFGIKQILVEGETRYDTDAIVGMSGMYVGQSIFAVNKKLAAEKIMETFPYIETVNIHNTSFDTIKIEVKEVTVIGARYAHGKWIVVGANGKALEEQEIRGDRPSRLVYLKGYRDGSEKERIKLLKDALMLIVG